MKFQRGNRGNYISCKLLFLSHSLYFQEVRKETWYTSVVVVVVVIIIMEHFHGAMPGDMQFTTSFHHIQYM